MRSTQAIGRPTADPQHRPPGGPVGHQEIGEPVGTADGGRSSRAAADAPSRPARSGCALVVDDDVPGAVGRELHELLTGVLAGCRGLSTVFAHDIAERVARFAQRGGRRVRARLVWWSLRSCGGGDPAQVRAALRTAAALELIQTCALVHDDLMDQAPTRRGSPALHADVERQYSDTAPRPVARRLGASAAVLAGDLALAWADDALTGLVLDSGLPPGTAHRLNDVWRTLRTEMVAGQYLDVQGQATSVPAPARTLRAACLKSARYTVERPLELGAVLAGADAATTRTLCRAGRCAGLAFQLRDDVNDLFADPHVTGKPAGGDVREGKPTYLLAVARALATASGDLSALGLLERAVGRANLPEGALAEVRDIVVATGARDTVEAKIAQLAGRCLHHLGKVPLEPRAAARLRAVLAEITGTPGRLPAPAGLPLGAALTGAETEADG
ncbi:polyprenyl synthetase family protein [Streptomyces litchfieldiae]|uniref:Polyprenyl synthetase family protein n=1 Tax=Streptomyces litchfieldiae TaxID=3075543 RepID=A0ABU2MN43_9ACTN|nr:polyprenyl synthetase family protein [Streptomyces sp. DSM 44938]MDT0342822.1 polyprenyl synthetase family protein [Streptomyces sp. DSM 44938]